MTPDKTHTQYYPYLITNNLKKYRRELNLTQTEVVRLLNFNSTDRISKWEKGSAIPSLINLYKLSIILKRFPHELYTDLITQLTREIMLKKNQLKITSESSL